MLAADARRVAAGGLGDERPQARGDAVDVVARQRLGEQRVGLGEQVVDVGAGRDRPAGAVRPRRVGVADQPAALPRDDEQDALLRPGEHAGLHRDAVARRRRRGCPSSARCAHAERAAGQLAQLVGPRARRAGDVPRAQQQRLAASPRRSPRPRRGRGSRSRARAWRCARRAPRPSGRRRRPCARRPPARRGTARRRRARPAAAPAPPPARRAGSGAGGAAPSARRRSCRRAASPAPRYARSQPAAVQRPQERHRLDEVRRGAREQQLALAQRLAHEPDVAHLEVAQPAVDELARGARGAGREVARLDEPDAQPARGGVERRARAGDPAADDERSSSPEAERLERPPARGGVEAVTVVPLNSGRSAA